MTNDATAAANVTWIAATTFGNVAAPGDFIPALVRRAAVKLPIDPDGARRNSYPGHIPAAERMGVRLRLLVF